MVKLIFFCEVYNSKMPRGVNAMTLLICGVSQLKLQVEKQENAIELN